MVLQTTYRALGTKRGTYNNYESILFTFMTTQSASNFYLILGTGADALPATSEGIESPVYLTRGSRNYTDHTSDNVIAITETFTNNTGSAVIVKEVGIKYGSGNENSFVLCREILTTPITMASGESHTFTASLKMTSNSEYGYFNNYHSLLKDGAMIDITGTRRRISDVSRKSDICPFGRYDEWGSNDTMFGYYSGRNWCVDVGFSNVPNSVTDIDLGDSNYSRRQASRTDVFAVSSLQGISNSDPSYFNIIEVKGKFTNNSDQTLVIREKGLIFASGYYDNYRKYLMTRQILDAPISVAPGDFVEISCAIKFSDLG